MKFESAWRENLKFEKKSSIMLSLSHCVDYIKFNLINKFIQFNPIN